MDANKIGPQKTQHPLGVRQDKSVNLQPVVCQRLSGSPETTCSGRQIGSCPCFCCECVNAAKLQTHLESWQGLGMQEKCDLVKAWSVERTFHDHFKRVIIYARKCSARRAVLASMEQLGGRARPAARQKARWKVLLGIGQNSCPGLALEARPCAELASSRSAADPIGRLSGVGGIAICCWPTAMMRHGLAVRRLNLNVNVKANMNMKVNVNAFVCVCVSRRKLGPTNKKRKERIHGIWGHAHQLGGDAGLLGLADLHYAGPPQAMAPHLRGACDASAPA